MRNQFFVLIFSLLVSPLCWSADSSVGLGFMIGNPTAISANFPMASEKSLDAALAYNFDGASELYLHSTYLTHKINGLRLDKKNFDWFYGFGGRFFNIKKEKNRFNSEDKVETHLGARGSLGASVPFQDRKFEIFGELAAICNIIPKTYVDLNLGLGGRFYF